MITVIKIIMVKKYVIKKIRIDEKWSNLLKVIRRGRDSMGLLTPKDVTRAQKRIFDHDPKNNFDLLFFYHDQND